MNNFLQYANAAQKAVRIGVTSAQKEFFENLPQQNNTKLEFVVGEEQSGGMRKSLFKNPGKCCGPYSEYAPSYKKSKQKNKRKNSKKMSKKIGGNNNNNSSGMNGPNNNSSGFNGPNNSTISNNEFQTQLSSEGLSEKEVRFDREEQGKIEKRKKEKAERKKKKRKEKERLEDEKLENIIKKEGREIPIRAQNVKEIIKQEQHNINGGGINRKNKKHTKNRKINKHKKNTKKHNIKKK